MASVLAKRAESRLRASLPTTGRRSSHACQRARNAGAAIGQRRTPTAATATSRQPQPSGRAEERARRDQRLREPRQRLPALLVHRNDLRNDVGQQHGDDREGDDGDDRRIDQREHDLLPQRLARFEIVGQARQHVGEPSGFRAGADQSAIQRRKRPRVPRQRRRQRFAGSQLRAHGRDDLRGARVVGLLGDGGQRLVERHARLHERGELARRQRHQRRRQPRVLQRIARAPPLRRRPSASVPRRAAGPAPRARCRPRARPA